MKFRFFINFVFVLVCFASTETRANEPNTLISVHKVELNNKNMPIKSSYSELWIHYRLENEETQAVTLIIQDRKAKAVYLEPGSYCFSTNYYYSAIIRIQNPLCFQVQDVGVTNAGTWVIGMRFSPRWPKKPYARLVDMKENYSELESILEVSASKPAIMTMPRAK